MKRALYLIGGAAICAAFLGAPKVWAGYAPPAPLTTAGNVQNSPASIKYTANCAMPQGGNGCCVVVDAGAAVKIDCNTGNTGADCYYREIVDPNYPDGGHPDAGSGAFAIAGADSRIPAATFVNDELLLANVNAICATSADGGTLGIGVRGP